jgi:hypothetical protein
MNRDLSAVIRGFLLHVPEQEAPFRDDLECALNAMPYVAPELEANAWTAMSNLLSKYLPADPAKLSTWQKRVVATWINKEIA